MASRFMMSSPLWQQQKKKKKKKKRKRKCASESITRLKNVHERQLTLQLPEGSEICSKILDALDTDEIKGENV